MSGRPDAGRPGRAPPEAWLPARRLALAVARPVERFLHVEAAGGLLLLAAAAAALLWANSPWHASYEHLWHTPVSLGIGETTVSRSLHFWINELLMTVFFLVVGLEIKRELVEGSLADRRRAALPLACALGGMLVPAVLYLALNPSSPTRDGWGVPMATDIAFAVGVLALLGRAVPVALRVLLLALAIIDDIGAIVVIAVFYSTGFAWDGALLVVVGLGIILILRQIGVRPGWILALPILVMWIGLYRAGIHPTVAGVLAGLMAPTKSWFGRDLFIAVARTAVDDFERRAGRAAPDHELIEPLNSLAEARREALSPALRIENALHPWVAYGIMPLFAFANAGVNVQGIATADPAFVPVLGGILAGLVVGKPLGVLAFGWLAVRAKLAVLPPGVTWPGVFVVGAVAGIGFTMAIFIAQLAFTDAALLGIAKLGVLLASALAGVIAFATGKVIFRGTGDARQSAEDVP